MAGHSGLVPFIISVLSYVLLGPFVLLALLANEFTRLTISVYLKLKYHGEVWLVPDGNDGIWATKKPGRSRMVLISSRYKGKLNPETIINTYKGEVRHDVNSEGKLAYVKLEYVLLEKFGYACWWDDRKFDIKNHVRTLDEKVYNKDDLQELFKELDQEMAPSRPQWEVIILPRYREKGEKEETGWWITRFNHTYMDSISALMFVERFMSTEDFTYYLNPVSFNIPSWKRLLSYMNAAIFGPYTALVFLKNKLNEYWPRISSSEVSKVERNYMWSRDFDLDHIRTIGKVTENTTIMAVVQNAFISAAIQVLPSKRIPDEWVIAELAVLLPYQDYKPQNQFTAFLYSINSRDEDFTRLVKSKKAAWEGMTGPYIPLLYFAFYFMGRMPLFLHFLMLYGTNATIFFSDFPGSKTKIHCLDNVEVLEVFAFPPHPNDIGITLLSITYNEKVKIAASAQSDWLQKEELDAILEKVPGIIEDWTKKADEKCIMLKTNPISSHED